MKGWANLPSGEFTTRDDADLISFIVDHGAVDPAVVQFVLVISHNSAQTQGDAAAKPRR
jgi:hypothetical protein